MIFRSFLMISALLLFSLDAYAHDADKKDEALIPISAENTTDVQSDLMSPTHPPLRLTPDRSEIIELNTGIDRVIIGNDANMNIFMDTPTRLIVVPRAPGATHFTLLGESGSVVMQRHVIVASPKEDYIRIRRTCAITQGQCAPTQVYYCPTGMCHPITMQGIVEAGGDAEGGLPTPPGGETAPEGEDTENPDAPPVE